MASSYGELYIKIAQMVIISIILAYFLYRRYRDRITGFTWFIWLFGLVIFQGVLEIFIFILWRNGIISDYSSLQEFHMIPSGIALFVLFLYLEFMRNEKPNTFLLATASTLLGGYIIVYVLEVLYNIESTGVYAETPEYRVSRVLLNIFQAFVLGEAFYVYTKDTMRAEYKKLKRISFLIATATGMVCVWIKQRN